MSNRALIVIPVFNEEGYLGPVLRGLRRHAPELDVLVVDDGSDDQSAAIAREEGALLVQHAYNAGYGVAIQTGLKYALRGGYRFALTFDGDGQHEPACVHSLLGLCLSDRADLAIGSRYLARGESLPAAPYRGPLLRRVGSRFFGFLAGLFLGKTLTDPTSGFLAMNERAMRLYTADQFPDTYPDADAIVLAHRAGLRIEETPVVMYPSPKGKRSMHGGALRPLRYVFDMLLSLGMIALRRDGEEE